MSTPRSTEISAEIRATDTETERGVRATFVCVPRGSALPRGNVLLVPGFTGSKEDFATLLPVLAESGWSAATYDQLGQFESMAQPDDDFSLAGLATDLVAVSAALFGTDERVHLVGHSFGGLVASTAAIAHSDGWASLTLMCSGPGGLGDHRPDVVGLPESIEQRGLDQVYREAVERDRANGVRPSPPHVEAFLERRFRSNSPEALASMARTLMATADLTPQLAALELPIAVLRGETDDAWPHDVQDQLAADLGTSVIVIAGAAHSPAVEQPQATRDALIRIWLG